eukprot:2411216-Prymnesium_polylepis.1
MREDGLIVSCGPQVGELERREVNENRGAYSAVDNVDDLANLSAACSDEKMASCSFRRRQSNELVPM